MKNQPKSHPLAALSADELLEHAAWLRSFAGALVRDPNEADDLVQGAFGAAVTAPSAVRDLRGYLAGTVRWLAWKDRRAHLRRRDRDTAHAREAGRTAPPADEPLEVMDMMRVVLEEVGKLPKTQGRAISLRYVEQLSLDEIARREGTTASTVRSNLARGLKTLRERLDERNGDRMSWCTVLAPFSLPASGGAAATGIESPALGATAPATVVTSASVLVSLMSLKLATLVAIPLALAASWYMVRGESVDPPAPLADGGATVARVAPTGVERRASTAANALDDVAESAARAVAPDVRSATDLADRAEQFPVAGRVIDRETDEGIPGLQVTLEVMDESRQEVVERFDVTTDGDGAFAVEDRRMEAGWLRVAVADQGWLLEPKLLEPVTLNFPLEFSLKFSIGPTFRFDGQGIDESRLARFDVEASGPGIHPKRPLSARARTGERLWVRFREPLAEAGTSGPWTLRLLSTDGLLVGTSVVERRVGIEPSPVSVAFKSTGAIAFVLRRNEGATQAPVFVSVSGAEGFEQLVELEANDGPLGGTVRHLSPGAYHWSMPGSSDVASTAVEVIAGEWTTVELDPATVASDRVGILDATAAPGVDLSTWDCIVFNEGNVDEHFRLHPARAPSLGADMWTVSIGTIPRTGWMMTVQPETGFELEPSIVSVESTGTSAAIRVVRSATPIMVTLAPVDSTTGDDLLFSVAVHVDGIEMQSVRLKKDGALEPIAVSAERATMFLVRKDGYKLTEVAFDPGRDRTTLRVPLEKGWRNRVAVVDGATLGLVSGVSVHIDGEFAGTTGADGSLWFDGDGPPKLIEVARDDETLETTMSPFERTERGPGDPVPGYLFLVRARK